MTDEELLLSFKMGYVRDPVICAADALEELLSVFDNIENDIADDGDLQASVEKLRHYSNDVCARLIEVKSFMDEGLQYWETDLTDKAAS